MPSSLLSNEDLKVGRPADPRTSDERLACADRTWLYIARFDSLSGLPPEGTGRVLASMVALAAVLFVISAALALLESALH